MSVTHQVQKIGMSKGSKIRAIGFILSFALLSACQKVSFQGKSGSESSVQNSSGTGSDGSCTIDKIQRPAKIMMIVDISGSNAVCTATSNQNECGTDPDRAFRLGTIQKFFNMYQGRSNFQWNLVTFASSASAKGAFTSNISSFQTDLNNFSSTKDAGSTYYLRAISAAKSVILADPDLNAPTKPLYFIVFLSDGAPTDGNSASINSAVADLVSLAPDQIRFSTVFYTYQSPTSSSYQEASQLLQSMSATGHGQFANVTNPAQSNLKLDDVLLSDVTVCQ